MLWLSVLTRRAKFRNSTPETTKSTPSNTSYFKGYEFEVKIYIHSSRILSVLSFRRYIVKEDQSEIFLKPKTSQRNVTEHLYRHLKWILTVSFTQKIEKFQLSRFLHIILISIGLKIQQVRGLYLLEEENDFYKVCKFQY